MSDDSPEISGQKKVQYYSACVNAYINNANEIDKHIIFLSAGGLGLLVSLMTTIGVSAIEIFFLYVLAVIAFVVSIIFVLFAFRLNAKYLIAIITDKEEEKKRIGFFLHAFDGVARLSFGFGIVFGSIIGLSTALNSYQNKMEDAMSKKEKGQVVGDSLEGLDKLDIMGKKSLGGLDIIKPKLSNEIQSAVNADKSSQLSGRQQKEQDE